LQKFAAAEKKKTDDATEIEEAMLKLKRLIHTWILNSNEKNIT